MAVLVQRPVNHSGLIVGVKGGVFRILKTVMSKYRQPVIAAQHIYNGNKFIVMQQELFNTLLTYLAFTRYAMIR